MQGTDLIVAERRRQSAWTNSHDDTHTDGSLGVVAAVIAVYGTDAHVEDLLR